MKNKITTQLCAWMGGWYLRMGRGRGLLGEPDLLSSMLDGAGYLSSGDGGEGRQEEEERESRRRGREDEQTHSGVQF
jgi:hypothetical protein